MYGLLEVIVAQVVQTGNDSCASFKKTSEKIEEKIERLWQGQFITGHKQASTQSLVKADYQISYRGSVFFQNDQ